MFRPKKGLRQREEIQELWCNEQSWANLHSGSETFCAMKTSRTAFCVRAVRDGNWGDHGAGLAAGQAGRYYSGRHWRA